MKTRKKILLFLLVFLLAGCNNTIHSEKNENITVTENREKNDPIDRTEEKVDYDLTEMNRDMIYATVYQMMADPDQYTGKTFRMEGTYYAVYYEPTQQYYHYCIIQDAMACCAQGMEFVWEDGSHIYPDEYPVEDADIIVEGIFETYRETGDSNLYCRLANASLQIKE